LSRSRCVRWRRRKKCLFTWKFWDENCEKRFTARPRAPSRATGECNLRMIYYYFFFFFSLKPKSCVYKIQKLRSKVENKVNIPLASVIPRRFGAYHIIIYKRLVDLHITHGVYKRHARYLFIFFYRCCVRRS